MLTNEDLKVVVKHLTGDDISLRAIALEDFWQYPSGDARIIPYLERLLHDKTLCLMGIPYIYGEIRWLAAHALMAERSKLGIGEPVELRNVVRPIDGKAFSRARKAANLARGRGGVTGVLESLQILRDMGHLAVYDLCLEPKVESVGAEMALTLTTNLLDFAAL
jgi:hypothetical protein